MQTKNRNRGVSIMSRLALLMAALILVAVVGPRVASAHAQLVSSTPAGGATVPAGLTQVVMTFGEEISADQSTVQLTKADGAAMQGASNAVDRTDRKKMVLTTPALADGQYTVKWKSVTEDDGGIVNGTFSFTVGTGSTGGSGSAAIQSTPAPAEGGTMMGITPTPEPVIYNGTGGTGGSMSGGTGRSMSSGGQGSMPGTGAGDSLGALEVVGLFAAVLLMALGVVARRKLVR